MQEHSLEVQSPIAMKPVAFLSHRIDSSSPLYGKSQQDLLKERGFLVISLSAVDDQTLQTLHSRMLYHGKAIRFGHAFEVGCLGGRFELSIYISKSGHRSIGRKESWLS